MKLGYVISIVLCLTAIAVAVMTAYEERRGELAWRDKRETLAQTYVGIMGRLQVQHHEKFGRFESDLDKLTIGLYPDKKGQFYTS